MYIVIFKYIVTVRTFAILLFYVFTVGQEKNVLRIKIFLGKCLTLMKMILQNKNSFFLVNV